MSGKAVLRVWESLNIQPLEAKLVWLFILANFLIGITSNVTYAAVYSTFLTAFDSQSLAWVYIANASIVSMLSLVSIRLSRRLSFSRIILLNFGALLLIQIAIRLFFGLGRGGLLPPTGLVFLLPILFEIFYALSTLHFWNLANRLFTIRQGKRFYHLIIGGRIIAQVATGLMMPLLVRWMGTANLLNLPLISLAGVFLLVAYIARTNKNIDDTFSESASGRGEALGGLREFLGNRYILLILTLVLASEFIFFLLDNIYYNQAAFLFPDLEQLAGFAGFFSGVMGLMMLILTGFFTRPWLNRFGVRGGVLVLPVTLSVTGIVMAAAGLLGGQSTVFFGLVLLNKLLNEPGTASVDRPVYALLYQLIPRRDRSQVQTTADGVILPVACGLTGVVLLILTGVFRLDAIGLSWIFVCITTLCLLTAVGITRQYPVVLRQALERRRLDGEEIQLLDEASLGILRKEISSPEPRAVLNALDLLEELDDKTLPAILEKLLSHPEAEVRVGAVERIQRLRLSGLIPPLSRRIYNEESPLVRGALLQTMAVLGGEEMVEIIAVYLDDPSPVVRLQALTGLLRSRQHPAIHAADASLRKMAGSKDAADRVYAARAIGEAQSERHNVLLMDLLSDPEPEVRIQAVLSAGRKQDPCFWPKILQGLKESRLRAVSASAVIAIGEPILAGLLEPDQTDSEDADVLETIVHICSRVCGPRAVAWLETMTAHPHPLLRMAAYQALHRCVYRPAEGVRPILQDRLRKEMESAAWISAAQVDASRSKTAGLLQEIFAERMEHLRERVLLLLTFLFDPAVVNPARDHLSSVRGSRGPEGKVSFPPMGTSPEKRAYAVEILESHLPVDQRKFVIPLLEDEDPAVRLQHLQDIAPQASLPWSDRLLEICSSAAADADPILKAGALFTAGRLRAEALGETVRTALSNPHPLVRETATWALDRLISENRDAGAVGRPVSDTSAGGLSMMTSMEKIVFLKNIYLFETVPLEVLWKVTRIASEVAFAEGERIIRQGEEGDSLYVLIAGRVDIVVEGIGKIASRGERHMIGEMAILGNCPRTTSCIASAPVRALKIEREDFQDLLRETPELVMGIIQVLVQRLEEATRRNQPEQAGEPVPL